MTIDEALWQDPLRVSGAVCFRNTRIPVAILFDYLEVDDLDGFYESYPDVSSDMVEAVIAISRELVESEFAKRKTA